MAEEKTGKEEITVKKDTLWKIGFVVLAVLLVVAIFTRGFGIMNTTGTGAATGGTTGGAVDLSTFIKNPNLYPSIGPANAQHTFVEFGDFQCVWCADAAGLSPYFKQLAQSNTQVASVFGSMKLVEEAAKAGKVRFVYVPVSFFGSESVYAAEAAYCANEQGKFWDMHDAIFAAHDGNENDGQFAKDKLEVLAAGINGIDKTQFNDCLEKDKYLSTVQSVTQAAQSFGVSGTPTVYYDGQQINPTASIISGLIGA